MNATLDSLPITIGLWLAVYVADYYLTLYGRRLWLKHASQFLKLQGSYELNPYYQPDVDANRLLSRRFTLMVVYSIIWTLFMWGATHYLGIPQVFQSAVGFLILLEVVVLSTHAQNIRSFQNLALPDAAQGQISFARWVSMDNSAWKFAYWGIVYLLLALLIGSWFLIGGAVSCLYEFLRLRQRGQRMRAQSQPVPSTPT